MATVALIVELVDGEALSSTLTPVMYLDLEVELSVYESSSLEVAVPETPSCSSMTAKTQS